jgi:hypothetical protein
MGPKQYKPTAPRQTARDQYMQNLQAQSNLNARYEQANRNVSYGGFNHKERMENPLWYQQNFSGLPRPDIGERVNSLGQIINQYARPLNSLPNNEIQHNSFNSNPDDDSDNLITRMRETLIKAKYEAQLKEEQELRKKLEEELKTREEQDRLKAEQEAKLKAEQDRLKAEQEAKLKAEQDRLKAEQEAKLKADNDLKLKREEETRINKVKEISEREELARAKREQEIIQQTLERDALLNKKISKTDNYLKQSHVVFKNILDQYLEIADIDQYIKTNILDQYLYALNNLDNCTLEKFYKELKSYTSNNNVPEIIATISRANLNSKYLTILESKCAPDIIVKLSYEYLKLASHIKPEII